MRPIAAAENPAERAWLSKGRWQCPAAPLSKLETAKEKPPDIFRRLLEAARVGETALAVVRYSGRLLLRPCVIALHHSVRATMVPATEAAPSMETTAFAVTEPREGDETMLLAVIEALVEWAGRIGELFETGGALTHCVGAQGQPLNRILRAIGAGARGKSFRSLLGEIAQRGLHRRPVLFLFSRELEASMQRCNAGITERSDVFRARAPMRNSLEFARSLLRVGKRSAGNR
jgi:hypothetical protein